MDKEITVIGVLTRAFEILGNVTLAEAVEWATVEENARKLREEKNERDENG